MLRRLSESLAYKLDQIDPSLDATRDEADVRMGPLRAMLRCASKTFEGLCEPSSENSIGAILSAKRTAELGSETLGMLLDSSAPKKPRVCLIASSNKVICIDEADELDELQRSKCVAVQSTDKLAMPVLPDYREPPHVLVTLPKEHVGGMRDAKIDVSRLGDREVCINTISAIGMRKKLNVNNLPQPVVDNLFAPPQNLVPKSSGVPRRKGDLPDYIKLAVAEFLERRVRLQVLCTASTPSPVTRPVVLDKAYIKEPDIEKKNSLSINATLHNSSSSCICGAHGLRFDSKGFVVIKIETCGRLLQNVGDYVRCPCHERALDESGNSRFNIDGICTEGTSISVTCFHKAGSVCKKGVCIDSHYPLGTLRMTDADRLELSTILVNVAEFYSRSKPFFDNKGWADNRDELANLVDFLSDKLRTSMVEVESLQLTEQDPEVHNPRELLRRDITSVDLLRGGGVFRHVHKSGQSKGHPYICRAKKTDKTVPLKSHESGVVDTHGHLFRKSM